MTPNVEERLSAAAFTMLTDDNRHESEALRWAVRYLRTAAKGRPTAFQAAALVRDRSKPDMRLVPIEVIDFYADGDSQMDGGAAP